MNRYKPCSRSIQPLPSFSSGTCHCRASHTMRQQMHRASGSRALASSLMDASAPHKAITRVKEMEYEFDKNGLKRAKYEREGWNYWTHEGNRVHFAQAGRKGDPVVLLIHGYGASAYHWRYQFSELSEAGFSVFALDLIGFGLSEKALIDYTNGKPWIKEISAFIDDVIGGEPVVLVGNSLGAYAALASAAAHPEQIRAVAMLNGAGPMRDPLKPVSAPSPLEPIKKSILTLIKRVTLFFGFIYAKQPLRIKQVLDLVYVSKEQIDDDLVTSIVIPATDPKASEVFFLINNMQADPIYVDDLVARLPLSFPMLLLWGEEDPWIVPERARKVVALKQDAELKLIPSGHCPHDDTPEMANKELVSWLKCLPPPRNRTFE